MKLNPISKKVASIGAIALAGIVMSGTASAVNFSVTADVQNALTVTNVADMNLGTLFATTASSGEYRYMTLGTDGVMGSPQGVGSPTITLLSLGGSIAAASASVAVGNNTPFTVTLPDAEPAAALDGSTVPVVTTTIEIQAVDPAAARFTLVSFRAGTVTGGTAAPACATSISCVLTPSFAATQVDFGVGVTLVTDTSGTRTVYQPTTYTGNFDVTASY